MADNEDEIEQIKQKLEIDEIKQKIKWEPYKSLATFLGVAVVIAGLAIERYNSQSQRTFDLQYQAHKNQVVAMTYISNKISGLCQETYKVIRGHNRIRVFGANLTSNLRDRIFSISSKAKPEVQAQIRGIVPELISMEKAFTSERDEFGYWVDAISLEGKWRIWENSPSPDFSLYFGSDFSESWKKLSNEMQTLVSDEFALSGGDSANDISIQSCISFVTKIEQRISTMSKKFCNQHSNAQGSC